MQIKGTGLNSENSQEHFYGKLKLKYNITIQEDKKMI